MRRSRDAATRAVSSLVSVFVLCAAALHADADARWTDFFNRAQISATFVQIVYDESGERVSRASGRMVIRRPDRMRWEYSEPALQVFILRHRRLFQYDEQLRQVVVSEIDERTESTPLGWLLNSQPDKFHFRRLARDEGQVEWFEVSSVAPAGEFARMEVGFAKSNVQSLALFDQAGRRTVIEFKHTPPASGDAFRIRLPKGVDVLGDATPFIMR